VFEKELGALEAFGKLLADGLFDDARSGEADQRAGLGDIQVAQHGDRPHARWSLRPRSPWNRR